MKIAIIEDEAVIRNMYKLKFQHAGYVVVEAYDGQQGLKVIEKEQPDVVLLDLRMPHMPGDEMLRELRAQSWGAAVPVIILTNISRDEAPRTLWHLGVSDYIVKANTTPQKVLETVESVLAQTRNA